MKYNAKFEYTDEQLDTMKDFFKKTEGIGKSKMSGRETIKKYQEAAFKAMDEKIQATLAEPKA